MRTLAPAIDGRRALELWAAGAVALLVAVASVALPVAVAFAVPALCGAFLLLAAFRAFRGESIDPEREDWLRSVTLASFVLHIAVALAIASSPTLVRTLGGDAVTYHFGAIDIVHHWQTGGALSVRTAPVGKEGFYYALAALYWVFGPYQVSGLVVNAALSAALVPVVHDTTRRLFGRDAARVAVVMLLVLPSFLIWTSQLLREAPVVFLLALAANGAVRLTQRATVGAYALVGLSIALLFTLRANVAMMAAAGVLLGIALGRQRLLEGLTSGAAALVLFLLLVVSGGVGYAGYVRTSGSTLQQVSETRQALATTASSGLAPGQDVSTPKKAISFLPVALVGFAFGPFPWTAGNARQWAGGVEALTLWFLFPSVVRGCGAARRAAGRRWTALGLPALLIAASLSLIIGNYGTIVRERLQVSIFLLPFAGYGWVIRRRRFQPADAIAPLTGARSA